MEHGRIAMVVVVCFSVVTGSYWLSAGQPLQGGVAVLNAVLAGVVFRRLRDAPRAV